MAGRKFISKKSLKGVDKTPLPWYNKDVPREDKKKRKVLMMNEYEDWMIDLENEMYDSLFDDSEEEIYYADEPWAEEYM